MTEEEKLAAAEAEESADITTDDDLFQGINMGTVDGKKRAAALLLTKALELGINLPDSEADAR